MDIEKVKKVYSRFKINYEEINKSDFIRANRLLNFEKKHGTKDLSMFTLEEIDVILDSEKDMKMFF